MNKCLYLFVFLILSSCSGDKEISLQYSYDEVTFRWNENVKKITFKEDLRWTLSSELPLWLSISEMIRNEDGHISFNMVASKNDTGHNRSAELVFAASDQQKTIYIRQKAKEKLQFIGEDEYEMDCESATLTLEIEKNVDYQLVIPTADSSWIKQVSSDDINALVSSLQGLEGYSELKLEIAANQEKEQRIAEVIIYNEIFNLSDTIHILQKGGGKRYVDGEYKTIQSSSYGNNVNIVIMGDGFTKAELGWSGSYEQIMEQAIEHFFSVEPYRSYRSYFNVYMVVAESKEAGVSEKGSLKKVQNKFRSTYGEGTEITCNSDLCFEYAYKVKELNDNPITIIVVLNSTKYAGTTYLYSDGNSIALCPMSKEQSPNDFEGLIHHEAGGHGFGFLCDEYVYYNYEIPERSKQEIREWQKLGFQKNLDFTDDISKILWKDFIGVSKYDMVGAYEGGAEYQHKVWRSEENSCMNNNIPYYNVQSRWSIVNRIMKLSGQNFTVNDFINGDNVEYPKGTYRSVHNENMLPLGKPKWIKASSSYFTDNSIN